MLKLISSMSQLNTSQLMSVYLEGNMENGADFFPDLDTCEQLIRAEEEFLSYLRDDFFQTRGAVYAVWVVDSAYVAALRLEPYKDGLLLEALETAPEARRKGYAFNLISAVLESLEKSGCKNVYSHVNKRNIPSLFVHQKCGFQIISDSAVYIDGTVTQNSYTLCYDLAKVK